MQERSDEHNFAPAGFVLPKCAKIFWFAPKTPLRVKVGFGQGKYKHKERPVARVATGLECSVRELLRWKGHTSDQLVGFQPVSVIFSSLSRTGAWDDKRQLQLHLIYNLPTRAGQLFSINHHSVFEDHGLVPVRGDVDALA